MDTDNISKINSDALALKQRHKSNCLYNDLDILFVDIAALADVLGAASSNATGGLTTGSLERVAWTIERETKKAHKMFESYCEIVDTICL